MIGEKSTARIFLYTTIYLASRTTFTVWENPHQIAGFYLSHQSQLKVLAGKELSFNNHQDIDATLRGLKLFKKPTVIITKHCNPCGIGTDSELALAYEKAYNTDTDSPYGGIVGMNRSLI